MRRAVTGNQLTFVLDHDLSQLTAAVTSMGEPAFRAGQVWGWLYRRLAGSFAEMTDLPRSLRDKLSTIYTFDGLRPAAHHASADGQTRKELFVLADGNTIESVLMFYDATDSGRARRTVCVSTQAGCALGCAFCATGQGGLQRNLTAGEIVG